MANKVTYSNLCRTVETMRDSLNGLILTLSYSESQKTVEHPPEAIPDPETPINNLSLFHDVRKEFDLPGGHRKKLLIWLSYKTERGETYSRFGMQGLILRSLQVFPELEDFTDAIETAIKRGAKDFFENQN